MAFVTLFPRAPTSLAARSRTASWRSAATALPLLLALAACGDKAPAGPGGGGAPPPAEVGVVTVTPGEVGLVTELPGRLEASRTAQVRARAAGIVLERTFREGSDVRAGQQLFRIDPASYAATYSSTQAGLSKAQANLAQTTMLAERYKPLVEANAISKVDYANALTAQKQAEADVASARAAVQTAGISLGYASVTAPISGRIGRALVTEGALVGQGEATPLALIQQIDPMYVNFTQSATEVLNLRRALDAGRLKRAAGSQAASVRIVLEDGTVHSRAGRLLFSDLTVDPTSGQVTLRAEVPNPGTVLLPGMYVRVQLEQAKASNAVLLPQQAVTRSTQGDSVMVVGNDGKVAPRPVKIGGEQRGQWVVLEGLKAGDQVMVDGFQKLQPGATVKPVAWRPGSPPALAGGAPGATTAGAAPAAGGPVGAARPPASSAPAAAK
jgi:membrane fusion protein (multidrug efflux system)